MAASSSSLSITTSFANRPKNEPSAPSSYSASTHIRSCEMAKSPTQNVTRQYAWRWRSHHREEYRIGYASRHSLTHTSAYAGQYTNRSSVTPSPAVRFRKIVSTAPRSMMLR